MYEEYKTKGSIYNCMIKDLINGEHLLVTMLHYKAGCVIVVPNHLCVIDQTYSFPALLNE